MRVIPNLRAVSSTLLRSIRRSRRLMRTWLEARTIASRASASLAASIWRAEKLLTPTVRILPSFRSFAISRICAWTDEKLTGR